MKAQPLPRLKALSWIKTQGVAAAKVQHGEQL